MANTMNTRLILRNADLSAWETSELSLLKGEMALGKLSGNLSDYFEVRIGTDGTKRWRDLSGSNFIIPAKNVTGLEESIAALSTSFFETKDIAELTAKYVNGDIAVQKKYIDGISYKYVVSSADLATSSVNVTPLSGQDDTVTIKPVSVWLSSDGTEMSRADAAENRKIEYTAYRYDTTISAWCALDGNYNADNVYFGDNMTFTYNFGKYSTPSTGSYVLSCKGKSVKAMLNDAYAEKDDPTYSNPTASWSSPSNKASLEVGDWVTGADGLTFTYSTDGKYTKYNNNKNAGCLVALSDLTITRTALCSEDFNGNVYNLTAINASFSGTGTIGAGTSKSIASVGASDLSVQVTGSDIYLASYSGTAKWKKATVVPVNNIGEECPEKMVPAGTFTSKSATIKVPAGYRKYFWDYKTDGNQLDIENLTSDQIRALGNSGTSFPSTTSTAKTTNFVVSDNTKQIIFAAPTGKWTKTIDVYNNSALGASLSFDNDNARLVSKVQVEGLNHFTAMGYDIWYKNFGATLGASNLAVCWK